MNQRPDPRFNRSPQRITTQSSQVVQPVQSPGQLVPNLFNETLTDEATQRIMSPLGQMDPIYEDLFQRVMRERDPKRSLHSLIHADQNSFNQYKDGWAMLNQRVDQEL